MPPVDRSDKDDGAAAVETEATDPKKGGKKNGKKKGDKDGAPLNENPLSEEDAELKERLDTCVDVVINVGDEAAVTVPLRAKALDTIVRELRTATASMTSVPKPLKFLRRHYDALKSAHAAIDVDPPNAEERLAFRARLADALSVLATTAGAEDARESLDFKLRAKKDHAAATTPAPEEDLGAWGHEFVRSLAGEIGREYDERVVNGADPDDDAAFADLLTMVDDIVPFHIQHNAEAEAVDLLIETQRLSRLKELSADVVDATNYRRVCRYLVKTADFQADPDDLYEMLDAAYRLYVEQGQHYDALRVALRLINCSSSPHDDSDAFLKELLNDCADPLVKKQMCILLGRHRVRVEIDDDEDDDADELNDLIGNAALSEHFSRLARDLDVVDAKTPEDIYKSHLAETGGFSRTRRSASGANVDSARANLASTFVNGFVNAAFCNDKLMTPSDDWLYKNRDHGMMSAAASIGLINLWNVDEGLSRVDKYLYSTEEHVKAGAALAVGILSSGVRNDADPALALLTEHVAEDSSSHLMRIAACTGFGIAYAGAAREEVSELLTPLLESREDSSVSEKESMREAAMAGLALGMSHIGRCDDEVVSSILSRLMEASEEDLESPHAKFLALGLGLLFLGRAERADAVMEALKTIGHERFAEYASVVLETCAYAGTGNVLKVQSMLHHCTRHVTEANEAHHQAAAVIGVGLITLGEEVGTEMASRTFDHLLHYCELPIRRAVPLALAVSHASDPQFQIVDQLSRLSHDPDPELSRNAVLALGIIGAGTNNSRIAGLLRQLSDFYHKEAGHVFCVRVAQGLLHAGKGLLSLHPFHSDRGLLCGPALGALLVVTTCCAHMSETLLDDSHWLLYYLSAGLNPRMLVTARADDPTTWRPVTARVGQAVETVGQAGRPRTITGFQTHTTPVLLGVKERAELGTEEVLAVGSVLEGIVLVKDNPDYEAEGEDSGKKK